MRPPRVSDRRNREGNLKRSTIFADADRIEMIYALAPLEAVQNLRLFVAPVRGNQHGDGPPDRFLGRVAEQPLRAFVPTGDDAVEVFADDRVVGGIDNGRQQRSSLLAVLAFGDVEQHVNGPDEPAFGIAERRRVGHEPDALAVGTLGDGFRAADGAAFLEGEGHSAFIVRQRRAVGTIQFPAHAPRIDAQLRHAAGKFDRCRIEVREPALGVGGVDRHRERVDHLAEATLALTQRRLGALERLVVPLLAQVGDHQAQPEGAFLQSADAEVHRHRRAVSPLQVGPPPEPRRFGRRAAGLR